MNTFKRSLAMMLVLCMLFSMAPITAFAEGTADPAGTAVPAADQPAADQPAADQPAADQPAAVQPAADQPAADQPAADQPAADQPAADQPAADQPVADQPAADQPVADQPAADQPVSIEETAKKVSTEDPYALNTLDLEDEIETVADVDVQYRILHLDCGRKYFTKDWIIALINEMADAGYNQLQLAFGNDGLRFLLDDMSVTANGTTYSGENVTAGIKEGNKAYYDAGDGNELTEDEMDAIIAHANSKGIAIVPHMNMPGHMDAILDAIEYVGISNAHFTGYTTSARSLNLNNDAAVAFTKALLQKYVDYFAANGCKFFHIGADEYANDAYNDSMGFPTMGSTLYTKFATFVNDCAAIVKGKGMTPRAWNDGISYPGYSDSFDTDIQITYWSQGWWGYSPAPASTLSANGHDMINTNGSYYFILTQSDGITNPSDTALNFDNTAFAGSSTIYNPVGSMFCIWCDYPGTATEQQVAAAARITLRKMAAAMKNSTNYSKEVIPGGFNADGTIAEDCNNVTVKDETATGDAAKVEVTGCDLTSVTVTEANAPTIADTAAVLAWDITPYAGEAKYEGAATVKLPVPADWNTSLVKGFYVENGQAVVVEDSPCAGGFCSFTMPHFSVGGLMLLNNSTIENTVNVRIPVGGTSQTYTDSTGNYEDSATIEDPTVAEMHVAGKAGAAETTVSTTKTTSADELTDGATFIIRYSGSSYALTSNKGETTWGDSDGDSRAFEEYSGAEADNMWTLEASGSGYKLKCAAGYLNLGKNAAWITASGGDTFTLTYSDGGWAIGDGTYNIDALGGLNNYLCAGGWPNSGTRFDLYKVTTSAPASTEVSFTGLKIGTTTAVVGTTQYNIEVLDPNDMFTKEENVELLVDEVKTITDNTGNYEASYTGAGLDKTIATVQVEGTTTPGQNSITPVTKLITDDTFYIQVSEGVYRTANGGTTTNFAEAELWTVKEGGGSYGRLMNSAGDYLIVSNGTLKSQTAGNTYFSFDGYAYEIYYKNATTDITVGTPLKITQANPVNTTTITITGVSEGSTKVIVGETRYNITVIGTTDITIQYQTANGTLIKTETVTVADNATTYTVSNFTTEDGKYYVVDNTTLNITPATVTEYPVTVTESEVDLDTVDPLKIEYWITNAKLTDDTTKLQYVSIAANDPGIYSNDGVEISDIVIAEATREGRKLEYWQSRILDVTKNNNSTSGTENQTLYVGDDETVNGSAFTHVRYWSDGWQVKTAAGWVNVDRSDVIVNNYSNQNLIGTTTCEKNQLVAYYMEIIDINNANGTTELHVNAADWGYASGENWGYGTSEYTPCTVSIQLVYQSGSTNPATTETADLLSKTLVYGYWEKGRGLGTMSFDGTGSFEIYQVTAETGDATYTNNYNGFTINTLTWDGNEEVVWEDENGAQSATIGNPANNPSYTAPKDNLAWNTSAYNQNNAILIRVYVRAVETEEDLKVVYFDEKFGDTLHTYFIKVDTGNNFNDHIINANKEIEDPGYLEGSTTRLDVDGFGIMNAYGQPDWFQVDLTQIPEAKGKYNSALYKYTGSEIKDNGKTLYLYYNIDTDVLSPNFVADFGLPLSFPLSIVVGGEDQTELVEAVTVKEKTKYGTLSYDSATKHFTYTPTEVLQNIDVLTITLTIAGKTSTTNVGVTPATTVYYGEKFLNFSGGWTSVGTYANVGEQKAEVLGESTYYGYDAAYAATTGASDGTASKSVTIGDRATFTFTGTGIQVFANASDSTGYVSVMVKNKDTGAIANVSMVDTVVNGTASTETTGGQIGKNLSGLPVVSLVDLTGLAHATYEVTISKIMDEDPVFIDGIRVFGTLDESKYTTDTNPYTDDEEDAPDFYEMRDVVMKAIGIAPSESKDYKTMYDQVYAQTVEVGDSAVITNASAEYGTLNRQDLLDNGPKNELYLFPGDTLTFNVETDRVVQLGLKAPEGSASYKLNGAQEATDLETTVDMFYKVANKNEATNGKTITVENAGNTILSVTLLKVCDDPNFAFVPLTEANIKQILADAGITETPQQPTYTMVELKGTDVLIDGTVFDYTGEPIEPAITVNVNGVQLVEGKDYSVTYTNNVEPGTATVTIRGIATASETLGYTGEVSIDFTINAPAEPEVPEETTKPAKPGQGNKPNQDNKPGQGNKPGQDNKPGQGNKPGQNNSVKKATLKITFVNLMGKKVSTATIAKTGTANEYGVFSAQEICEQAPARRHAVWFLPAIVPYGTAASIVVPVI